MSLGRETDFNNKPLIFRKLIKDNRLNVFGLSCSGWATEKCWESSQDVQLQDMAILDLISCSYDNFLRNGSFWEFVQLILVGEFIPVLPLIKFRLIAVIINDTFVKD
jgi:hypothetical protein